MLPLLSLTLLMSIADMWSSDAGGWCCTGLDDLFTGKEYYMQALLVKQTMEHKGDQL